MLGANQLWTNSPLHELHQCAYQSYLTEFDDSNGALILLNGALKCV